MAKSFACFLRRRGVNALIGRWKHICGISYDIANIYVFSLNNSSMAASSDNNRYVWTNEETEIFNEKKSGTLTFTSTCVVLFPVCNPPAYFFGILLQPWYATLSILPSTNKTSVLYLLQPLYKNPPYSGFHFLFCFC